ncbi:methyl-accepting chemotaxis protein [Teredinibacter sp. KSP-S5-2]|uniref:methyl-accepting chemotaxis protein n=1 Tax=Teredinibacter sp. KSP-S5-2 TaxID=3034506 RepID=UPI00293411DD|nr:methyl-accepting chemotaxis protein [Teredinibacter sp. KSP-S5-2]WNO10184.1 methyl-accepting chemotaxis protein [Teredinibacter sp. KSP-S5-2]
MFRKLSIKLKIALLSLLVLLSMGFLGALGVSELIEVDNFVDQRIERIDIQVELLEAVEQAHVHFKMQVQEWKNVLIRGNDKEQFDKYFERFVKEENTVQELLKLSIEKQKALGIDSAGTNQLLSDHKQLGKEYKDAIKSFNSSDRTAGQTVDKLVKGVDRAASKGMEEIALRTEDEINNLIKDTAQDIHDNTDHAINSFILYGIVFSVLVLVVMLYTFYDIYALLGGEPAYTADIVKSVADGNLDLNITYASRFSNSLLADIASMKEKLTAVISDVRASADALASASEEVSSTAQGLSKGASAQAASVEETSASMEEMSASISQNNENANVTDGMAQQAAEDAISGGNAVSETVEAMQQIAERISVIDDIAYQTNLLALNAAIEAGRAGEHGRGFAVVASEVRKLAERSQVAAQDIGELATNSVKQANVAGALLEKMVPSIRKTADLVQEIAAASSEQTSGVHQINSAIGQVSMTMQQNAAASEELSATSEEMSSQAMRLKEAIDYFSISTVIPRQSYTSVSSRPMDKVDSTSSRPSDVSSSPRRVVGDDDDQYFVSHNE